MEALSLDGQDAITLRALILVLASFPDIREDIEVAMEGELDSPGSALDRLIKTVEED